MATMSAIAVVVFAFAVLVAPGIMLVGWLQERIERREIERRLNDPGWTG